MTFISASVLKNSNFTLNSKRMGRTNPLAVRDIRRETPDTVSIAFEVPDDLEETYQFIQGQYLTLIKEIDGEEVRRSYSICTSPSEDDLRVAVKEVPNGKFSTFANRELKTGDVLEVMKPMGRFYTQLDPANAKQYVLFAAGSGITPIMSIVKTTLETEPNSEVTLVYGNKNFESIIFREELEGIKSTYMERFRIYHVLSRETLDSPMQQGRISAEKCDLFEAVIDFENTDEFFLCGPRPMIESVRDWLENKGIDKKKVHFELFTSAVPDQDNDESISPDPESEDHDDTNSHVTVIIDGDRFYFDMPKKGKSILDAAAAEGADVPFSCKGGVCCTCMAKLAEGEVTMDLNYALTEDEVARGFVLACQSHPTTDKVVVNFDDR